MRDIDWATMPQEHRNELLARAFAIHAPRTYADDEADDEANGVQTDELSLSYRIAEVARDIGNAMLTYTSAEQVYEAGLTREELKEMLSDFRIAQRIIDMGQEDGRS